MHFFAEYIWIDGFGSMRSKARVMKKPVESLDSFPSWHFDGSSTGQAEIGSSDVVLQPVRHYPDPFRPGSYWVLCQVMDSPSAASPSNTFYKACLLMGDYENTLDPWFGFEQEFFVVDPAVDPAACDPPAAGTKGLHYCGVGYPHVKHRAFLGEALEKGLAMGIQMDGCNLEVAPNQLEVQVFGKGLHAASDLWAVRYLLLRLGEVHRLEVSFEPKPFEKENGSGCHTNISTRQTRQGLEGKSGYEWIVHFIEKGLDPDHAWFMEHVSGEGNKERMTGSCETATFGEFTWAAGHRGKSIRIPEPTVRLGKGYFEDRRPASSMDPYLVVGSLVRSMGSSLND
jgi:glutamine synthetase